MAIIYTYPTKATPIAGDLILISDSADANKTKQVTVGSLPFTNNPGTVTSVGLSMPSAFEVGNSPVTSSGTINVATVGGNAGQFLSYDGTWRTPAGGAANPAGALTQIQYHDTGGVFGASANLSFSTDRLTLTDTLEIKGDGVNPGTLKLYCENVGTPHAVSILGPIHSGATPYSIRLPKEIATQTAYSSGGRVLESDASGALQWIATPTGGGSGPGTGTQYNLPIWSTTSTLGDSLITQNAGATVLNVGTNIASFSTVAGVGSVFTTRVSVNGYSTFGGKLKLSSPDGATSVEIEGPANGGAAYTVKMPSSLGTANQVLKLPSTIPGSGASQLVWGDATGGVTYTFSTGLSESGGTVTLDAGLNNLTNVSFTTGANSSLYVGQISPSLSGTPLGNVTLGGGAAKVATTAFDNTFVGSDAAALITEGSANVAIGSDVAATLTTGTNNVIIGDSANILGATLSSTTVIGQGASGAADSTVIGKGASASTNGTAIGSGASASGGGIAIGKDATAAANEIELNGITSSIVATTGNTAAGDLKITINGTVYYIALRTYAP